MVVGGVRGSVVFLANRSVGVPSCPSPPRSAALSRAAPPRAARGMSGFWTRLVKVCNHIQPTFGREQRAAAIPLINRISTRCQASVVFPNSYHAPHEKVSWGLTGIGPLVSSQERRAAVVTRINCGSTADKPVVNRGLCSPIGLHRIPGHALHEKGLQIQIGDGPLVSSQEQRAAVVPQINRWSTASFVPPSV